MLSRTTMLVLTALPFSGFALMTQECEPPAQYDPMYFPMEIEGCSVNLNGDLSIHDITVVAISVADDARYINFYLPNSCMNGVTLNTQVEGAHVVVEAGLGCASVAAEGPGADYPGEWAEIDALEFDGFDLSGGDGVVDYIEGNISASWMMAIQTPVGTYITEEVDCSGRPFSANGEITPIDTPIPPPTPIGDDDDDASPVPPPGD